jgi:hypothetical protein
MPVIQDEKTNKKIHIDHPKRRVTFDIPDENETSGDFIDHRDVGRPTEDVRAVKNNITINENEPNEDYINFINVTNTREPTEDRRGTNDDVPFRFHSRSIPVPVPFLFHSRSIPIPF